MTRTALQSDCRLCDGTGWRPVEREGRRAVEPCSCRVARRDLDGQMQQAEIPPRFRHCNFDDFLHNNHSLDLALIKARRFAEEYPLVEKGILFIGNPGVGKTHLTVAILKHLMAHKGADCFFCSYPSLLKQVEDSYDAVAQRTSFEILQPVLETDVVAIDDLGARRVTGWAEDTVTYLLNHRYNQKKLTLITTNLPDSAEEARERSSSGKDRVSDTLQDRIGLRVYSRLFEMCEKVPIHATDLRQEVKVHQQGRRGKIA